MKKFVLLLFLFTIISSSSCVYKSGGAQIYEAESNDTTGERLVKEWNVKYISPDVIGVFFADVSRKDGEFAYNIKMAEDGEHFSYDKCSSESVAKFHLKPKFNWWQRNGKYISIPIFIIVSIAIILILINGGFMAIIEFIGNLAD